MKHTYPRFTVCSFLYLVLFSSASLAVANTIHFQGRLTDTQGSPVAGRSVVKFEIFTSPSGGVKLWSSSEMNVDANDNGLFSADVGPFSDPSIFSQNPDCYLQVSVQAPGGTGFHVLNPRQKLASVPYAFSARVADTAVSASQIPDNIVTSSKIADGSVTGVDIADGSIQSRHLRGGSVVSIAIATGAVLGYHIKDGSIDGIKLKADAVSSGQVKDRSLLAIDVASGTLTSVEIENGGIKNEDLADNAITSNKIKDDEVATADLKNATILLEDLSPEIIAQLLPRGIISMFASTCPDGWRRFDQLDGRFPIGNVTYTGNPGGSKIIGGLTLNANGTHSHTVGAHSHTSGSLTADASPNIECPLKSQGGHCQNLTNHTHAISGNTGSSSPGTDAQGAHAHTVSSDGTWLPPYLGMVFCEKTD